MSYNPMFCIQDYTLRPPKNDAELVKLHQLGTQLFGDMVWPLATIQAWIGEYAYGCLDLFHHDKPIGSFDLWPLQAIDIEALAADEVEESSLRPVRLSHLLANGGNDHWYIASLMLAPEHRDHQTRRCFSQMICMALNNMADSGLIRFPAQISAVGYSPEGQQLLEHVGLRHDPSAKIDWGKFYRHAMPTRNDFFWPTIRTTGVEQLVEPLTTQTT